MKLPRMPFFVTVALLCGSLPSLLSCTKFDETGLPGSTSSMAHNQLMYVSREKQTFGYFRIQTLRKSYQDLDYFVQQRGMPEFLAETTNDGLHYYIFYYLEDRAAYASRPRPGTKDALEFSGPYPITPREVETLENLRERKPDETREEWAGVTSHLS